MSDKPKVWEPKNPINKFVFKTLTEKQLPPNYELLEEAVQDMINLAAQTSSGDQKRAPKSCYRACTDQDVIMMTILVEACAFVLSGDIDKVRDGKK